MQSDELFGDDSWEHDTDHVEVRSRRHLEREKTFKSLPRSHKIYKVFYKGLPDPTVLPDTVREFVVNEKWPQGTYSAVGLEVNDRIAVLCTPIIAMGWGKRYDGEWET